MSKPSNPDLSWNMAAPEPKEMTPAEVLNLKMYTLIFKAVSALLTREANHGVEDLNGAISDMADWLRVQAAIYEENAARPGVGNGIDGLDWSFLHWAFSILDALKATTVFLDVVSKEAKSSKIQVPSDKITELTELVQRVYKNIRCRASEARPSERIVDHLKQQVLDMDLDDKAPGIPPACNQVGEWLERMAQMWQQEGPPGHAAGKTRKLTFFERIVRDLRESWEDALNGILSVKL